MKVTVFSTKAFEKPFLKEANHQQYELKFVESPLNENTVNELKECDAIITFPTDDITARVLDKLKEKGVRYVAARSAGVDHIDIEYAKELGIKLSNAPKYSPYAVAEHAVGMMLVLNRKFIEAYLKISQQNFSLEGLVGFDMNGSTVGVLGTGNIGSVAVKILNGLGCRLLLWDKKKKEELEEKYDAKYVDLDTLCRESDIITIHLPLNEATRYLIDKEKIDKMKEGVMIINAARGAIIKTEDLIAGLKSGKVGSAGLDVYEKEKELFFKDRSGEPLKDEMFAYLLANKHVLITGHQAFATDTALRNMASISFESLNRWEKGEEPENQL